MTGYGCSGVACSGLSDHVQDELPDLLPQPVVVDEGPAGRPVAAVPVIAAARQWHAGLDVEHAEYGRGWVQGSGVGRVTVRFEGPHDPPGKVRTFSVEDPALQPAEPAPYVP